MMILPLKMMIFVAVLAWLDGVRMSSPIVFTSFALFDC